MTYSNLRRTSDGTIIAERDGETIWIPPVEGNKEYDDVIKLESKGKVTIEPAPADPEPRVMPLTARQLRLGIIAAGFTLAQVTDAIDMVEDSTQKQIALVEWEYATLYEFDHPLISMVAGIIGLDQTQLKQLWLAALEL